jgi:signal transduction histidine kinase
LPNSSRSLATLTDGRNLYGKILPLRNWLEQLAQRDYLLVERPLVATELTHRYARQKINLNRMSWLAALLAAGIGFTILIDRNLRMRQATRIKEQFAADLHDELGANLHTIGLLVDLAKDSMDSRAELTELLDRCRLFTQRSGVAARHCINLLEARSLCEDLVKEMKHSSSRLLADLTHEISFEGEAMLQTLSPRKRIDLFLFYKECLTNIIRHSGATSVSTRIRATPQAVCLTVTDNGCGIDSRNPNALPHSLQRRARLLGAQVVAAQPAGGGTQITLKLKLKRFGILK